MQIHFMAKIVPNPYKIDRFNASFSFFENEQFYHLISKK